MLYHVYEFRSKSKKDFNNNYDNLIDDNDNSNKLLIKDMNNKEKFHVWFNRLFDKYYDKQDNGHGNWLSSKTTDELPSFNNTQQINSYIEEKKKNLSKDHALIKQNYELNIPCVGEEIYNSEKEIYSNNDIFSKFQYEDVKIAHNETLIPVSEDILETKEKYNSLNDIKNKRSSVNYKVMSKNDANKYLYEKNSNETNIASHKAFELIKEQEKNMDKNNLFWSELKMLQIKK